MTTAPQVGDAASSSPGAERRATALRRLAGLVVLAAVGQFVVVSAVCIVLYPGGHQFDRAAAGYSFWHNVVCDLGKDLAMNGQPNLLAPLFNFSFVAVFLAFAPMWLGMAAMLGRFRRLGRAVAVLGLLSVAGALMVAVLPADSHGHGHMVAIGLGAIPGLLALAAASGGLAVAGRPRLAALGVAMLAAGLWAFWFYVANFWLGMEWTEAGPQAQKAAALIALAWMGCVGWAMCRPGRERV